MKQRHIPISVSQELAIYGFENSLDLYKNSVCSFDKDKWLYIPHEDLEYRYILGTAGENPLICVGINPSTAKPDALDRTLQSVERISLANGYDSFIMFNVYAQRATIPDHMDTICNLKMHQENMEAFRYCLEQSVAGTASIWAAWGTIIEKRPWLKDLVGDMIQIASEYSANWFTAGKRSKKGHPHHPLYLPKNSKLDPFEIQNYMSALF